MSKKCSVRSLSDSSLAELANLLVSTISYVQYAPDVQLDINILMVELNEYLAQSGATSNIYQDLLRVILSSDYLEANMRFTCLQMLLNCGVHFLVTEVFPPSYYEKILQVIAAQGAGLRVLNLKGIWVKEDHMHYMYEIVRRCKQLVKLYVPYIANDQLLEEIALNCNRLQILDISGETDITEIGIDQLAKGLCAQSLTVVDVGMPGEENICYSDIALILEHCPRVETLSTYSFVGAALKFIYDNIDTNFKCRLKYAHDTATDEPTLQVLLQTCPQLETLYLDSPKLGCLRALQTRQLRKLKICKFVVAELISLLERPMGQKLRHLTLIKGSGNLDLGKLARLCPSLIDLDCYVVESLSYASQVRFQQLEGLEILSCDMMTSSLKAFLCNTTDLKRLAVDSVDFTDDDIISMFVQHDFKVLEDIWFTLAPELTVQAVELLMESCPELQSVGQLTGWSLTPDDLSLIRGLLKSGNSSLVLTTNGLVA
ncbi:uncharacterized protein LOC132783410 isoform X1 [Drosophila nasuta]|uniref:Uncharacterized protein LOC117564185 isoform X1 n=1 Tax=Drosophila albomicans TaxID=7291 RepID=A0A6P8W5N6_DROAB|nr:uncharacterized protein LOC117564185 isoform X1 [Drosophila albomicans]XP_060644533.1 uncharacterized protein LOC132783410 isoform X1 [Drosophila nasuta]